MPSLIKGCESKLSQKPRKVFVFGSNLAGRHGAGAAKDAFLFHGAKYGIGEGLRGDSYALPTMDAQITPLPLPRIKEYIDRFLLFANANPTLIFKVTRVGCGRAGYDEKQIAPFFKEAPKNCRLPQGWRTIDA